MTEQTVYCEECVEDIPGDEVYWEDGRLYCRHCGSELEVEDRDIFEEIVDNRNTFLFRDGNEEEDVEEDEDDDQGITVKKTSIPEGEENETD